MTKPTDRQDSHEIIHLTNPLPDRFPPFFRDGYLFLRPDHLLGQPGRPLHFFALLNRTTGQADARFAFFEKDGMALSPSAASFGSVEFAETVSDEMLRVLMHYVTEIGKKLLSRGIRIVSYPDCYESARAEQLRQLLVSLGYYQKVIELNQHVHVSDQDFEAGLHPAERRRLRKGREAGFSAGVWEKPEIGAFFDLLKTARARKGHPLTMSREGLEDLLTRFPEECPVFGVWDQDQLIAACLGIRVSAGILYYFQPADHSDYLRFSPSVMLIESLYAYCREQGVPLLDLGISTSGGIRNEGLIRFKQRLGARESAKSIFEITF
ncbi:GNAT family N-acetyltransferase [Larkinella soli]|uniref:GNAT family N-acetyltransferase n=1 Tax=Larkinella soli TaxID=1770527 RepID=UPI0013E38C3E|nr:GNAT family N-acetyltransferase [Larkinella soli]